MTIATKFRLFIGAIIGLMALLFMMPWLATLSGKNILIDNWANIFHNPVISISASLWLIIFSGAVISIAYKSFATRLLFGREPMVTFWMPFVSLLFFLLNNFYVSFFLSGQTNPLQPYRWPFFAVLVLAFALGMGGRFIYGRRAAFKQLPVKPFEWALRVLLLLGMIYPCFVLAAGSSFGMVALNRPGYGLDVGNYVSTLFRISWLYLFVALVMWLLFIQFRFARRMFAAIGILGLLLAIGNYANPRFVGYYGFQFSALMHLDYIIYLLHWGFAYLIIGMLYVLYIRAAKLTCPSCHIFYSGEVIKKEYAGNVTRMESYVDRVQAGAYRAEPGADLSQGMFAHNDDYITVTRRRAVTEPLHRYSCVCRDCGHEWNFVS